MLYRLYEPILWRALGVANATGRRTCLEAPASRSCGRPPKLTPHCRRRPTTQPRAPPVRRNAAALMVDAFPISEPAAKADELDLQMQRQFDALEVRDATLASTGRPVLTQRALGTCRLCSAGRGSVPGHAVG